jgi:hypothetical protein
MGKAPEIANLEQQNAKFQAYLKQITADLQKRAEPQLEKLDQEINDFYKHNGWKSEKFIAGENVDFMHTSSWSLDKVKEVVDAIATSVFGGTPTPGGTEVIKTPEIGEALAAMENLELYLASRVVVALSGVLEVFGNSTTMTFKTQYKSEALGNGFHLFTVMACDTFDAEGFNDVEKIVEYLYSYEVRFSADEAQSHARIALIDALTDAIEALGKKIKQASTKWVNDEITDEQYAGYLATYKNLQDTLTEQLKDLAGNKAALTRMVAVPSLLADL